MRRGYGYRLVARAVARPPPASGLRPRPRSPFEDWADDGGVDPPPAAEALSGVRVSLPATGVPPLTGSAPTASPDGPRPPGKRVAPARQDLSGPDAHPARGRAAPHDRSGQVEPRPVLPEPVTGAARGRSAARHQVGVRRPAERQHGTEQPAAVSPARASSTGPPQDAGTPHSLHRVRLADPDHTATEHPGTGHRTPSDTGAHDSASHGRTDFPAVARPPRPAGPGPLPEPADAVPPSPERPLLPPRGLTLPPPPGGRRSSAAAPDKPPDVTVSIGRIEVVHPAPAPPPSPPAGPRRAPHAPQLADYLRDRSRT
jgi:hypothetical protein